MQISPGTPPLQSGSSGQGAGTDGRTATVLYCRKADGDGDADADADADTDAELQTPLQTLQQPAQVDLMAA